MSVLRKSIVSHSIEELSGTRKDRESHWEENKRGTRPEIVKEAVKGEDI